MPHAPRSQNTIFFGSTRYFFSPLFSFSPFLSFGLSIARASRLGGSQARTHIDTRTQRQAYTFFSLPSSRCPRLTRTSLSLSRPPLPRRHATERSRQLVALPGPPAHSVSLLLCWASPSPRCHESMRRTEDRSCVIRSCCRPTIVPLAN